MATLVDSPEFTANEVYEIAQTDPVEGAGVGASFGGIGVSNEPHQQLANRTAYLKNQQATNTANIGILQAFVAGFKSTLGPNGYIQLPLVDSVRGAVTAIIQWGVISMLGQSPAALKNAIYSQKFPVAFPNACFRVMPWWEVNSTSVDPQGAFQNGMMVVESLTPFSLTWANIFSDYDGGASIYIASTATDGKGLTGIGWLAVGY